MSDTGQWKQDIRKQMDREVLKAEKEQNQLLGNATLPTQLLTDTKLRVNNNLVLESRKDIIATALAIQTDDPEQSQNAFWLINKIKPLNFINRKDARGKNRSQTEINRLLDRIKNDIERLEQGRLLKGNKTIRKLKIDDFTLIFWPMQRDDIIAPLVKIRGPVRQFVHFQNFDRAPPSLKRKINPYKSDPIKYLKFNVDKYTLDDPVPRSLRQVVFDRLYEMLVKIKGYDKKVEIVQTNFNDKAEYMKNRIKEMRFSHQLQVVRDEIGEKMVDDFLANPDNIPLLTNIITYQIKRINPTLYTKDTIVTNRKVISTGLLPFLEYGKSGVIENQILSFLNEAHPQQIAANYDLIKTYGINPFLTDRAGYLVFQGGLERNLYNLLEQVVVLRKDNWDRNILSAFIIGAPQERITNEQLDQLEQEWEQNYVFNSALSDGNESISIDDEEYHEEDVLKLKELLRRQVDDLETNIFNRSISPATQTQEIRPYILNVSELSSQLEDPLAADLKFRIRNGSLAIPTLAYLDKEELLPELFMNAQIVNDTKFTKWFFNQVFTEANMILQMWNSNVTDPFPVQIDPRIFDPSQWVVKDICTTQSKFYVKTQTGIRCMTAAEIRENIDELRQYNRKDLDRMIEN